MLSDRFIRNAKPGKHADGNGLYLKVYPTGVKSFVARTQVAGKDRITTLGQYPKMGLAEARDALEKLKSGHVAKRFVEAWGEYYAHLETQFKDPEQVKRIFERDLLPSLGDTDIDTLQRAECVAPLQKIVDRGAPVLANRALTQLRRFLDFCEDRGWVEVNPVASVRRQSIGGKERPSGRNLSLDELKDFMQLLVDPDHDTSTGTRWTLAFCMVTGCRPSEALWALREKALVIPEEVCKTSAHRLPSTPLIRWMLRNTDGDIPRDHRVLSHALRRLEQTFTPHKFRHTLSSRLADLGVAPHVAEKLLNHKMTGVMAVYNRADYWPERIAAQRLWERTLLGLWKEAKKSPRSELVGA